MPILIILVALVLPPGPDAVSEYTSECGYTFQYPSTWEVTPLSADGCGVRIQPRDLDERLAEYDVDLYTVIVTLPDDFTFLDAARRGFDFYRGEWVTVGRQGMRDEAHVVKTDMWTGLRGNAFVGCFHEAGGYAGLCGFDRLLLQESDGDRMFSMDGGPQSGEAFEVVLSTFGFVD